MKSRGVWIAVIVGGVALLLGLLVFFGISRVPPIEEQVPPGSAAVQVHITTPASDSFWPMNREVNVQAAAKGPNPIRRMDLYINGVLYATTEINQTDSRLEGRSAQWLWQPGTEGQFILTVHSTDSTGNCGISDPVLVTAGGPATNTSAISAEEGFTLEAAAEAHGVSLEDVLQANPGVDPNLPLVSGQWVYIPIQPDPDDTDGVIPGYYAPGSAGQGASPPDDGESGALPDWGTVPETKRNFWKDLMFYLQKPNETAEPGTAGEDEPEGEESPGTKQGSGLPGTPIDIVGKFEGCDVMVSFRAGWFKDRANPQPGDPPEEEGFFVYRSRDGGEFERAATLPPFVDAPDPFDLGPWTFVDEDQYGLLTYYIAAFNKNGESPSAAVSFPLDQMNCAGPEAADPYAPHFNDDYDLILPFNLDTAYLYVQINDSPGTRVPEGDRFFLPGSGIKFNLNGYLAEIVDKFQLTDFKVNIEVWGWVGGKLIYVGDLEEYIHRSVLTICSREGKNACAAGGDWVGDMTIIGDNVLPLVDQTYDLHWQSTSLSETDYVCMVITPKEFFGPGLLDESYTLLYTCYYSDFEWGPVEGNEGYYLLNLGNLLYPDPASLPNTNCMSGEDCHNPDFDYWYPKGTPFTLSLRVTPVMVDTQFNKVSNTAFMRYFTSSMPPEMPPLASDVPSMYEVEILEDSYIPPKYEIWEEWGCVIIDEDPTGKYAPGTKVCPQSSIECDNCGSGLLDMLEAAFNYIAGVIEDVKDTIAGEIAGVIPGCSESATCQDVINKGIDYGVSAMTGLPPDMPNFDEFVSQSVGDYIVGELTGVGGPGVEYICGDTCRDVVAEQIKPYIEQAKSAYSQPWCSTGGGRYGKYPECFNPPIKVHPAPGAGDYPGYVSVRVTRKTTPESLEAMSDDGDRVRLRVMVEGENSARVGYYGHQFKYLDNIPQSELPESDFDYTYLGDQPMREALYEDVQVPIPWLAPGESIDIPVSLKQFKWENQKGIQTAHSQYLFFRGITHMTAMEYCFSLNSSWEWVPCTNGGQDKWSFPNPEVP